MSDSVPPAFERGAAENSPAKNRRVISAPIFGARAAPIPNKVARRSVTRYTGNLPYTTPRPLAIDLKHHLRK
jgi:hypothetical protein